MVTSADGGEQKDHQSQQQVYIHNYLPVNMKITNSEFFNRSQLEWHGQYLACSLDAKVLRPLIASALPNTHPLVGPYLFPAANKVLPNHNIVYFWAEVAAWMPAPVSQLGWVSRQDTSEEALLPGQH